MANVLGGMVVKLALDAAEFIDGMTKSEYEAKKFAKAMEANGRVIGQALTIGVTAAAGALFLMVKNSIDAADKLNDLSKATGVSVETLGGLGFAAKQSGTDLEGVGKAFGKLRLQIAAAVSGNKESAQLFDALKISIKDLKTLSSEDILFKMADQFATFDDHANTAALANKAFGKSYMDILPLLGEGGKNLREQIAYYAKWGGVTTETAQRADEFNDTLGKLGLLAGAFGRELTAALLPSITNLAKGFLDAKENGAEFKEMAAGVADFLKVMAVGAVYTATEFKALGTVIGARAAQLAALARFDFKASSFIGEEVAADIKKLYATRDAIVKAIQNPNIANLGASPRGGRARAQGLDAGAGAGAKEAKQAIADYTNEIQRLNDEMLKASGGDGGYTHLIAANEQFQRDLQAGKAVNLEQVRTLMQTAQAADEQAASIKAAAEAWKVYEEEQAKIKRAQDAFTDSIGRYAEENDALKREIGVLGEDDAARQKLAATLEYERLLKQGLAADDVAGIAILKEQYAERLKLIDTYNQTAEALRSSAEYNRIFTQSFADALTSVADGTLSVSQAFKAMTRSIVHDINQIAAQNIAKALFGVNNQGGGGIGDLITKYAPGIISSLLGGGNPNFGNYATGPGAPQLGGPGGNAAGTDFWRGGPTWVGERGPEIINLPKGAQVIPNDVLRAKREERAVNNVFHVNVLPGATSASVRQTGDMLRDVVMRSMRNR